MYRLHGMRLPSPSLLLRVSGLLLAGLLSLREVPAADEEGLSFKVEVVSENRKMARHLERHLDIQRFADFPENARVPPPDNFRHAREVVLPLDCPDAEPAVELVCGAAIDKADHARDDVRGADI